MPCTRDYWDKNMRYDKIADIMPIKRFEQIKRFLHVSDNMQMPKDCPDKLFKIRPLIDVFNDCTNRRFVYRRANGTLQR